MKMCEQLPVISDAMSLFYLRFLRKERLLLGCPMPTCRNEENIDNFSWLKLSPVHYNLPKQPFSILKWYNFHCNESFSFLLSYLYHFYVCIQYSCVFGWDTDQSFCVPIDLKNVQKVNHTLIFLIPKKRSNILNLVNIYVPNTVILKVKICKWCWFVHVLSSPYSLPFDKKALPALRGRSLLHLLSIFSFQVKPIVLLALCPDLFTDCHAHCWGGVVYKHKNGL